MAPTPYVYQRNPGTRNSADFIKAIHDVLFSSNPHHWTIQSYTYTSTSVAELIISCDANPLRWVKFNATVITDVVARLSLNGGSTYVNNSQPVSIMNYLVSYQMSQGTYGVSSDKMFVVEVEDAIMVYSAKGAVPTEMTGVQSGSLGPSLCAGSLLQMQNKNDEALGITGDGIWGGTCGGYDGSSDFAWLSDSSSTRVTTNNGNWWGSWVKTRYINNLSSVAGSNPFTANVLDGTTPRMVPWAIEGPGGASDPGQAGYSKYIRSRAYGWNDSDPVYGTITNATYIPTSDANVWWRHNESFNGNVPNNVVIWCDPANIVVV